MTPASTSTSRRLRDAGLRERRGPAERGGTRQRRGGWCRPQTGRSRLCLRAGGAGSRLASLQELEAATATGADETERLVHGAIAAGIEGGLVQGLGAALKGLREAREATGGAEPAWLRQLLDGLTGEGRDPR